MLRSAIHLVLTFIFGSEHTSDPKPYLSQTNELLCTITHGKACEEDEDVDN